MYIKTDDTKKRIIKNDFDKIHAEKQQELNELGVDRIIPLKNQSREKIIQDMEEMKNQAQERIAEKNESRRNKNEQMKKSKRMTFNESEELYHKRKEERERKEYEARKIKLR